VANKFPILLLYDRETANYTASQIVRLRFNCKCTKLAISRSPSGRRLCIQDSSKKSATRKAI